MLSSLYLRNFVIVREAELGLREGMTAITGETGAGKSILIDALNLVLGGRTSSDIIRHGEDQAEIIASFDLADCSEAISWLQEHELDEEQDCVIRRVLRRSGPSRGFINGRPVVMQQLRQLGDYLVDIHGQHEHQSLLRLDDQRKILDSTAGNQDDMEKLSGHYDDIQNCQQQLDQLRAIDGKGEAQLDLLRYQVNELEQLALETNETTELEDEHRRLANSTDLISGINENLYSLSNDGNSDVEAQLNHTISRLQQLERLDPALMEINQVLLNASIHIDEAIGRLKQYIEQMDTNPQRLEWVNQRMGTIHDLARKHRVNPVELPSLLDSLKQQLDDLESGEQRIDELENELALYVAEYREQAARVSQQRRQTAINLSQEVTSRMQELGMEGGTFVISISDAEQDSPRRHGLDKIEYLVAANSGQAAQPLNKVASGGELSRIALALQVCVLEASSTPTLIFDEIDVGIGGRVAEIVGQQLARLGSVRQVLCITHLAQVAANAHQQILISKSGDPVEACINSLENTQRVEEIARMMGGIEITAQTRAHAEEMLKQSNGYS
ncbi:MAG: DNA repair protein RecN [Gammaproteobacteria bacterium]|nr:DNA repair protein RecN [Gammaproteobacteria bacterium]MDX2486546.1 DNA repair protein RecN [Gammaproteobacteria bacterium]